MSVDIRKGDLVKATRRDDPEVSMTGRVRGVRGDAISLPFQGSAYTDYWSFELLDRPLPPIDEELLEAAAGAYIDGMGYIVTGLPSQTRAYRPGVTAVINFVREYDRKNTTKENSK